MNRTKHHFATLSNSIMQHCMGKGILHQLSTQMLFFFDDRQSQCVAELFKLYKELTK